MKKLQVKILFLCVLSLCISIQVFSQKQTYKWTDEIELLKNIDQLPVYRSDQLVEQMSSYDRTGGNNDGFYGTFSYIRKENDKDPFNRISGTTGIQGAVDSSFILVEETRGSGVATLSCIGRDIDYREIKLKRDEDNVWQVVSDSFEDHDLLIDDIVILLSDFMKDKEYHKSTPTELADELSKNRDDKISSKTLSKKILQNTRELEKRCISAIIRKSNGKRLIEIFRNRVDRVDKLSTP